MSFEFWDRGASAGTPFCRRSFLQALLSVGTPLYRHSFLLALLSAGIPFCRYSFLQALLSTGTSFCRHSVLQALLSAPKLDALGSCVREMLIRRQKCDFGRLGGPTCVYLRPGQGIRGRNRTRPHLVGGPPCAPVRSKGAPPRPSPEYPEEGRSALTRRLPCGSADIPTSSYGWVPKGICHYWVAGHSLREWI